MGFSSVARAVTVFGFTDADKILVEATTVAVGGRTAYNLLGTVASVTAPCHVYFGAQTSDVWVRLGPSGESLSAGVSATAVDGTAALLHIPAGTFVMLWIDGGNSWCRDISLDANGIFRIVRSG